MRAKDVNAPRRLYPEAVRDLRIKRGWTVAELAARAKVSIDTIKRIESKRSNNKNFAYIGDKIAKALDVPVERLNTPTAPSAEAINDSALRILRDILELRRFVTIFNTVNQHGGLVDGDLSPYTDALLNSTTTLVGPFPQPDDRLEVRPGYFID